MTRQKKIFYHSFVLIFILQMFFFLRNKPITKFPNCWGSCTVWQFCLPHLLHSTCRSSADHVTCRNWSGLVLSLLAIVPYLFFPRIYIHVLSMYIWLNCFWFQSEGNNTQKKRQNVKLILILGQWRQDDWSWLSILTLVKICCPLISSFYSNGGRQTAIRSHWKHIKSTICHPVWVVVAPCSLH